MTTARKFRPGHLRWWLLGLLPVSALAASGIAFLFPHRLLTVESGDVKADALVVLGGGMDERAVRAAELFKAGAAPIVVVSGYGDYTRNVRLLEEGGVPPGAIVVETGSISTLENAEHSVALLREKGVRRAIIVTSWYHSRRAFACFRHADPTMKFYSRPAYQTYQGSEWDRFSTSEHVRTEYFKLLGYWICYGVPPF